MSTPCLEYATDLTDHNGTGLRALASGRFGSAPL